MRAEKLIAAALGVTLVGSAPAAQNTVRQDTSFLAAAPRFTDPDRRTKLARAFPEIDRLFADFAATNHVPGAAWGIVIDGELAHSGAFGYRDTETKAQVNADTVFRIASMTKSFTAMAILSLRDEGKLSLDDPAERFVPELKGLRYPTDDSPRITVRHLLSHSEGFPEDNPWGDQQLKVTREQMLKMISAGIPFSNAPGVAYEYSNYGFAILGEIVSRASGRPYNEYLAEKILRPLGMTATTMDPGKVPTDRLAHGYRWEDERWKDEPLLRDGAFGPMGGMLTSIRELSRYVAAHLAAWPPRDGADGVPIRRASLREMQQVARFGGASTLRDSSGATQLSASGYGYGLRVSQDCTFRHVVTHSGGLPGFGSQMRWLPDYGVGVIAFGNLTYAGWANPVTAAFDLLAKTGALQPREIQPSPALLDAQKNVTQLVSAWDDRLADSIAAENLFLDQSRDRRRAQVEELRGKVGWCRPSPERFDIVENALRGQWSITCDRGRLLASVTLAPTTPPKVQYLNVRVAAAGEPVRAQTCAQ
jgi:CubicO group peptidase (beta-lactamase class C family)